MNNKKIKFFIAAFCLLLVVQKVYSFQSEDRPNILFILTDDQAPWAFGASGDPNAYTPNIDKLADKGVTFQNAFTTTPVCSPSRTSIMTGRYASEYNILDFIVSPTHSKLKYDPNVNAGLDPSSITFAEMLQKSGYYTGLVGKWHLGDWASDEGKKYHPKNHGFDFFMGLTGGGASPVDPELEIEGKLQTVQGLTTDILTDQAISFINEERRSPFLLCFNTRAPHSQWLPVADEDWAPFENLDPVLPNPNYPDLDIEKVKKQMKEYLASTAGVDRNVGRLITALEEKGIMDNTIVIFMSDHGYNMGHNGIKHKGNGKWITKTIPKKTENINEGYRPNLFDNSLKIPAIVYWKGVTQAGRKIDQTISVLDVYPTLLEMAGVGLPSDAEHKLRGRSLIPLIKGEEVADWDNDFYSEYSMVNYATSFLRSYRTPEWKLVRDFMDPSRDELYHIALDPEENINLIHDNREEVKEIVAVLHQKILDKMKEINDPLLGEVMVDREYFR
ncbi:sulfatase-like hydrolase/transferase [Cyclobacterium sp. 1_MG-2023]|uniref:sulfatase-like hydrolase/transferase n=1 Tax=Cyclobacterium sp. 1_MG-2023 TaxID=3062681 RepID=UPI0026E4879E|nr:sulfatase-like hydrolase/transferase [Cyclobacterium sp. 1_MG-2023]MDO6437498.1 sulfatase-like hydrolase/transferase [Cyclobacterium sp. 1_MG-2023]